MNKLKQQFRVTFWNKTRESESIGDFFQIIYFFDRYKCWHQNHFSTSEEQKVFYGFWNLQWIKSWKQTFEAGLYQICYFKIDELSSLERGKHQKEPFQAQLHIKWTCEFPLKLLKKFRGTIKLKLNLWIIFNNMSRLLQYFIEIKTNSSHLSQLLESSCSLLSFRNLILYQRFFPFNIL